MSKTEVEPSEEDKLRIKFAFFKFILELKSMGYEEMVIERQDGSKKTISLKGD